MIDTCKFSCCTRGMAADESRKGGYDYNLIFLRVVTLQNNFQTKKLWCTIYIYVEMNLRRAN